MEVENEQIRIENYVRDLIKKNTRYWEVTLN